MVVGEVALFHALDCETRAGVLRQLYGGPMSPKEIAHNLSLGVFAVVYHLEALETAGLITKAGADPGKRRTEALYMLSEAPSLLTFPRREYDLFADQLLSSLLGSLGPDSVHKMLWEIGYGIGASQVKRLIGREKGRLTLDGFKEGYVRGTLKGPPGETRVLVDLPQTLVYRVYNCPWSELAHKYPKLLCECLEGGREEALVEASGGILVCRRSAGIPLGKGFCEFEVDSPRR